MDASTGGAISVMTYNILVGGSKGRIHYIETILNTLGPDIIGLQEVNDPDAFRAMAERLGMHCVLGYATNGFHVGLLSRWPITAWAHHSRPVFQKGLIEAVIPIPGESQPWHIFVAHLTADFFKGSLAERRRRNELRAIIECMDDVRARATPHLLMGDFNALTPGERFDVNRLLTRVIDLDAQRGNQPPIPGQPHLKGVVPPILHPLLPIIRRIPTTPPLAALTAAAASLLLPRLAILEIINAGYVDCLAKTAGDPALVPPTCPIPLPAGRIDYLWASPSLLMRLQQCVVVADGPGLPVDRASDHHPLLAQFTAVRTDAPVSIRSHDLLATQLEG